MIEINLIPDVKHELLRARRLRTSVISLSILVALISGGVVTLLALYVFGVQTVAIIDADNKTKNDFAELSKVEDLSETLTIQNQLSQVSALQAEKNQTSRLFDLLTTIVPTGENTVSISTLDLDTEEGTITMEAEAPNGYEALEVFKKTIAETKFEYMVGKNDKQELDVATNITEGERSYGENSEGDRVLRFTLSFEYAPELLDTSIVKWHISGPTKQNATDSTIGIPDSLFTDKVEEEEAL